eukprot:CAMPEP_0194204070 /NCGR_PEP_ID=MMETSP0156-20130528/3693_1 /TAXON_ID=33649 /ORGANISM="Thalassionema nitzschioides, Strain L26-B" /LENGTH=361 /DNA_ID=CAMNT_0038929987 /DNA_START=63 /DNA_END=1148 /DNA_ORIENTATION=+
MSYPFMDRSFISMKKKMGLKYLLLLIVSVVWVDAFSSEHVDRSSTSFSMPSDDHVEWEVYVDQSKDSISRGATATFDAFQGMSPPSVEVRKCELIASSRSKSPVVRCISRTDQSNCLEITNVDSVDKVYRILTHHLKLPCVDRNACECIKWKHQGNAHLEKDETDLAIKAYDRALEINCAEQEGVILMMRAHAYLQRAASHKVDLKKLVLTLTRSVVDTKKLNTLHEQARENPVLATSIFQRIESYSQNQETNFRSVKYRHGLYQFAVLHAVQDALRATQLVPDSDRSWLAAADCLSEFWKLPESIQYYKRAAVLNSSNEDKIRAEISRLQNRQQLLDAANSYGWSQDMLRLALDVGKVDE